jgi:hypothetical protein
MSEWWFREAIASFKNPLDKFIFIVWAVSLLVSCISYLLLEKVILINVLFPLSFISFFVVLALTIIILFRKGFGLRRFFHVFVTTAVLVFMFRGVSDIPAYLQDNYGVAEGIPSKFEPSNGYKRDYITVQNVEFTIPTIDSKFSKRWFIIKYLPNSKIIKEYRILSEEETSEKLKEIK